MESSLQYLFDLTTSAHWGGLAVGVIRVERELARRARHHLGDNLAFCVYDRFSNRILTIDDDVASEIVDGRLQIDFTPAPSHYRLRIRRLTLANATIYHAAQFMLGRRFTRKEILRIRNKELATLDRSSSEAIDNPRPIARVPHHEASLNPKTLIISGGLDWEFKDLNALRTLKQVHRFRYCAIVHDIIPILFPHLVVPSRVATLTNYFGELAHLADCAMCNSQATRQDWRAYCAQHGLTRPAHVFPLGFNLPVSKGTPEEKFPQLLRGKRFAMVVATFEPRKNHRMLYEAWDRCIRSRTVDPERDRLVFVGNHGWATDDLMREIATNPATRDSLIVLHLVPDALLHVLYQRCDLVLVPSLYEGYGLPLAEALAHDKPCISSYAGGLVEIGGDLVLRLDSKDTVGWAHAIGHYLASPPELDAWSQRIKTQYRPTSWDDAATRFFATVKDAAVA